MRSVMKRNFAEIPSVSLPRSTFDRSHGLKTTFDAGYMIPVLVDEALPGDTIDCRMTAFGRLATPLFPFMDNLHLDSMFFAVPYRLLWSNWERFNGAQDNPGDSTDFLVPVIDSGAGGFAELSIFDYFGIPVSVPDLEVSAFAHRAYNLIYNTWLRDENLQDSVTVDLGDGPDNVANYPLLKANKRHDYFTQCLPWPQKGPAVELPLGTQAPIASAIQSAQNPSYYNTVDEEWLELNSASSNLSYTSTVGSEAEKLFADLSQATAATIMALRQAAAIQRLYEKDARGGTRYIEVILNHFGVRSPDARLQRPEFLGGGSERLNINPIAQTSEAGTTPQGNLAAMGTLGVSGHGFKKSFTEHCLILGLVRVRADLTYQQGLDRMWSRQTRWDFYWPELDHIGEQAVLNKEIFAQGTAADDDVFGYAPRYDEYRTKLSRITGLFRSDAAQSLDPWHLGQDFASLPVLDSTFIEEDPPLDRVVATPAEPDMLFDAYFKYLHTRAMGTYSVPGATGRF